MRQLSFNFSFPSPSLAAKSPQPNKKAAKRSRQRASNRYRLIIDYPNGDRRFGQNRFLRFAAVELARRIRQEFPELTVKTSKTT
ncbi:MAG: hypothetical protein AAGA60_09445 [Cyanobacteria bacterium P01_E01_bin.42]